MSQLHMILQGKGGVGKSMLATMIAQYKACKGIETLCFDTDPINASFSGFKALNVQQIQIMEEDEIKPRNFDKLIELIAESQNDVICDNGASSFVPLTHYLISNHIPELFKEMGHKLVVHCVIVGGQSLLDTVSGFAQLALQLPKETLFIVWLNPFWGKPEMEGKTFEQMKAFTLHKDRVSAIIKIPTLKEDTYGRDFSDMLQAHLTFDEAIALNTSTIMVRQRLKIIQRDLFSQIELSGVL